MIKEIKATIQFTVDKKHPDYKYMENPNGVQEFSDTYRFDLDILGGDVTTDEMKSYIRRDLRLVAGGGYNSDHIHNVKFIFD